MNKLFFVQEVEVENIVDTIECEVLSWSNVTAVPHRFGGIEFRVGNRELGHLHGHYQADIPFSARLRKALVASGHASPHHLYPNSGWVSYYIHSVEDVPAAIKLFRLNYDRLIAGQRIESMEGSKETSTNTAHKSTTTKH